MKKVDLVGQKFGRLTVLHEVEKIARVRRWHCKCECGKEVNVYQTHLVSGGTKSCGCLREEMRLEKKESKLIAPKPKCKYPLFSCKKSRSGMCCKECDEYTTCRSACMNTPEKCGYKKVEVANAELEKHD